MPQAKNDTAEKIAKLNDAFRTTGIGGRTMITSGVSALGPPAVGAIAALVRSFTEFHPGDNPYGQRDFGAFDYADQRLFWKIDYFDRKVEFGSDDPADPTKTTRVLTIMLADEY